MVSTGLTNAEQSHNTRRALLDTARGGEDGNRRWL